MLTAGSRICARAKWWTLAGSASWDGRTAEARRSTPSTAGTFTSVHPAGDGFHAAVAFYPPCRVFPAGGITAPLLMLLGSADDWTPPGQCESSAPTLRARGAPIEWHVYYGATHAFDAPAPDRVLHIAGRTFHLRYDSAAADDAHARVLAFFGEHLK